eukprot:COSAG01_NODE_2079_length_8464_cov_7.812821_12_plen_78_part_00
MPESGGGLGSPTEVPSRADIITALGLPSAILLGGGKAEKVSEGEEQPLLEWVVSQVRAANSKTSATSEVQTEPPASG